MIDPYVNLAVPFKFILSNNHLYYRNTQFFIAIPLNMILVMYVILCILSYDFNKLAVLYIHVYLSLSSMTNKSVMTYFLSIKYLSVCLYLFILRPSIDA